MTLLIGKSECVREMILAFLQPFIRKISLLGWAHLFCDSYYGNWIVVCAFMLHVLPTLRFFFAFMIKHHRDSAQQRVFKCGKFCSIYFASLAIFQFVLRKRKTKCQFFGLFCSIDGNEIPYNKMTMNKWDPQSPWDW